MASEWTATTLAEVSDEISYGYTESADDNKVGPHFLRITDIQNGVVDWKTVPYCPINDADLAKYTLKKGDIVVARTGNSTGENYIFDCDEEAVFASYLIRFRIAKMKANPHFVWYSMRSPSWWSFVNASKTGSAQAGANAKVLGTFELPLPPLAEQRAIANILGVLDDKIELNRRMNETLEGLARAIFQSWFVDFDPVRAQRDGLPPPALSPATAALFPDSFEDSELGKIPKGWEVGRLDDVLTLQRGFDLPTPDRTHGMYPVMAASGPNGCHNTFMVRGPGVTTGRSGVLGKVFYIHGDFWPLNTSLWVKEFTRVSPAYAFHLLRGLDFEMFNAGSAVPTLNRNHVHNLPVVIPPKLIVEAFDEQAMPLMKQQKANEDQSRALAAIRDALLPKLLSGEIHVAEAERLVEDAG